MAGLLAIAGMGIVAGRWSWGSSLVYGASLLASLAGLGGALWHLLTGAAPETLSLGLGLPGVGANFRLDELASFFLIVVNLGGAMASLYAIGYGRHESSPLRVLPFFPAYLAGMNLVVLADDAFAFLVAWEFMSLSSWALVVADHRAPENARAGYVYLVMASFGTLALLLAFGLLAGSEGGYAFASMRMHHPDSLTGALVLLLALVGAGSKAGLVPLHVWLPLAHPAAPSHVSALMSGVMTKVAIYGFIRIVFDLVGDPVWWTSLIVLAFAAITAVMGILSALMQNDLKRLLAYSTVENVGIVFIGLGLAVAFRASRMDLPAALALTAALFHVFNHSLFKSLLFFGSGAVLTVTGERNMEHLGGLIHRMPKTATLFLIGCGSISALPPLNGFVSEWLTFQAILVGPGLPQWGLRFMIPTVGALLALSAALAAACFVKAYGVVFLGRPRTPQAERAQEVDHFSLAAMFVLAALCFMVGVLPGLFIDMLGPVVKGLAGARMPVQTFLPWASIVPIAVTRSSYNGLLILLFLAFSGTLAAMFVHRYATRAMRRSDIWDCGYPDPPAAAQYSSSSFAMPIRRVFGTTMFVVRERVDMPRPGETRAAHFHVKLLDPAWRLLYGPVARAVMRAAVTLNQLQFLTIRRYLTLVFATLVLLLLVVAAWR
ncbi:MAG: hydrogenase-4 component [Alphaproteobacteria bacterium]|nr:hydrogenase-4 component [Alphaproteobacteria bacterium]